MRGEAPCSSAPLALGLGPHHLSLAGLQRTPSGYAPGSPFFLPTVPPPFSLSPPPPGGRGGPGWEEIAPEFPFHTSRLKTFFLSRSHSLQLLLSSEMPGQGKGQPAGVGAGWGGAGCLLFVYAKHGARVKVKAKAAEALGVLVPPCTACMAPLG